MLRELGADEVVLRGDVLRDAIEADSIDVVVDLVAGEQWPQYLEVLRRQGRYAVSGAIAGAIVELDVRTLYLKDLSLLGCTVLAPEVFGNLVAHIEQGRIAPLVAASLPLEQIGEAQALFQEKRHVGKIVLVVNASRY
jgi:NADPH:quinone reductase-like Zn-dependent oxidoreductase